MVKKKMLLCFKHDMIQFVLMNLFPNIYIFILSKYFNHLKKRLYKRIENWGYENNNQILA